MQITQSFLDSLTAQAQASPRLRINYDLRNSPEDQSQRMLNAIEPGTMIPIHQHDNTSETVVVLRGKACWIYYVEDGKEVERILVEAGGDICGINVPKGQRHTVVCLKSGTVIFEAKDGKYIG